MTKNLIHLFPFSFEWRYILFQVTDHAALQFE